MHNTVTSHCDFSTPHNGHSVRHRYEKITLNKKIDRLGFQDHVSTAVAAADVPLLALAPADRSTGKCGMGSHVGTSTVSGVG